MKKLTAMLALFTFAVNAQTFYPSKDVSLGYHDNYNTENKNFGAAAQFGAFVIQGYQGGINSNRGLMAFDLASIPAGTVIQSAKLNLYAYTEYVAESTIAIGHIGNNACYLKMCTAPWSEFAVTWNTQPSSDISSQVLLPQSTAPDQDYLDIDVTEMIQYFINNPSLNNGFLFGLIDETIDNNLSFHSRNTTDPAKRPELVIKMSPDSVRTLKENKISLYPNPANDKIKLVAENNFQRVNIFDAKGEMVYESPVENSLTWEIDLNQYENGVYIVEVQNENGSRSVLRFVKNGR